MDVSKEIKCFAQLLATIPPREAVLWGIFMFACYMYFRACNLITARLSAENQRLTEEKRDLWNRLDIKVPNSMVDGYNQKKESKKKK